MSKKINQKPMNQTDELLQRLIELSEKNLILSLYSKGANREQIKNVVGIGTDKADKIISKIKSLKRDSKNGQK